MLYLSGVTNDHIEAYAATERRLGLMAQPRSSVLGSVPFFGSWAFDNGAFGAWRKGLPFDFPAWLRALDKVAVVAEGSAPLFVVVPDVVADHDRTAEMWGRWSGEVLGRGLRPAFVLQNGCRDFAQVPVDAGAVFIGGDDVYKLGPDAARVCWQAQGAGCWAHMGRVSSEKRFRRAIAMGCDSADGTFLRFGPPALMLARVSSWLRAGSEKGGQTLLTDVA